MQNIDDSRGTLKRGVLRGNRQETPDTIRSELRVRYRMHRLYFDGLAMSPLPAALPEPGAMVTLEGDEAEHAVVKRLEVGEAVELLNGRGMVAGARVESLQAGKGKRSAVVGVRVETVKVVAPVKPEVTVYSATPKGDRAAGMIDQLCQLGIAAWGPLETARGVVDPRESKLDRLERVAIAASKQCGRAHLLTLLEGRSVEEMARHGGRLLVADASGGALPARSEAVTLLVGPEGGWTEGELELLRGAGATVVRFGPHVMRVETAAVAGAAMLMAQG